MSKTAKERMTPELRAKISRGVKKTMTPEHRARLSAAHKRRKIRSG